MILDKLREGMWNVGIIDCDAEQVLARKPYQMRWMKHRYRDRFFADPFLLKEDDTHYYILCEEYKFIDRRGTIVLLKVDKKAFSLVEKKRVINEPYHLSYPFVHDGMVIPEAFKSGAIYGYALPELKSKTVLADKALIDTTWLDRDGKVWAFATTKAQNEDAQSLLSIFYLENGELKPHKLNPVKRDFLTARPGGGFFERNGVLYRPAQNCENFYGENIRLMRVKEFTTDKYAEEEACVVRSTSQKYKGIHTFNAYNGFVIIDGYREFINPQKVLYAKLKRVYKRWDKEYCR